VVYLTKSGAWALRHKAAILFKDVAEATIRLAEIARTDTSVVGPYVAAARLGKYQTAEPVHFREAFRATGPSNRFIGKQTSAA
jgi:hypothetical protein